MRAYFEQDKVVNLGVLHQVAHIQLPDEVPHLLFSPPPLPSRNNITGHYASL